MKQVYEKSELAFALLCIAVYCALQLLANWLNPLAGIPYGISALFAAVQALVLWRFVHKNRLTQRFGLCLPAVPARQLWYYLPLLALMTRNLWNGVARPMPLSQTGCYILFMLCVGFLEELLFRGFLFQALARDSRTAAIALSSVTFGLGHLLNLLNGSGVALAENLLQVCGAVAVGLLFIVLFDRSGSLLPCIAAHAFINISTIFASGAGQPLARRIALQLVMAALAGGYAAVLAKTLPPCPPPRKKGKARS